MGFSRQEYWSGLPFSSPKDSSFRWTNVSPPACELFSGGGWGCGSLGSPYPVGGPCTMDTWYMFINGIMEAKDHPPTLSMTKRGHTSAQCHRPRCLLQASSAHRSYFTLITAHHTECFCSSSLPVGSILKGWPPWGWPLTSKGRRWWVNVPASSASGMWSE